MCKHQRRDEAEAPLGGCRCGGLKYLYPDQSERDCEGRRDRGKCTDTCVRVCVCVEVERESGKERAGERDEHAAQMPNKSRAV